MQCRVFLSVGRAWTGWDFKQQLRVFRKLIPNFVIDLDLCCFGFVNASTYQFIISVLKNCNCSKLASESARESNRIIEQPRWADALKNGIDRATVIRSNMRYLSSKPFSQRWNSFSPPGNPALPFVHGKLWKLALLISVTQIQGYLFELNATIYQSTKTIKKPLLEFLGIRITTDCLHKCPYVLVLSLSD